jgi:hypothetical protein
MTTGIALDGENYVEFDIDKVGFKDAIAVEKHLGVTWLEFLGLITSGSMGAMQCLAWLVRHGDEPDLAIDDVDDAIGLVRVRDDGGEDDTDPLPSGSGASPTDTPSSSTSSTESNPGSGTD